MKRWILRLYPQAWRERYEAEVAALLEDAPAKPTDTLDLLKGALVMQFAGRYHVLLYTLVGVLIPWAIGYGLWTRAPFRSETVFFLTGVVNSEEVHTRATRNRAINAAAQKILSRQALAGLIEKHQPYDAGPRLPLEDHIELMRKNTHLTTIDDDGHFRLAFQHHDPQVAHAVNRDLTAALTRELQDAQASSISPGERVPINTQALRFLSLAAGFVGFLLARRYRRTAPVTP